MHMQVCGSELPRQGKKTGGGNQCGSCSVPVAQNDPTDSGGTFHPQPTTRNRKGAVFNPLIMDRREPVVKDLPDSPLHIFQSNLPVSIVKNGPNP